MYPFKYENPDQLNDKQLWLLATSAMLAQLNSQRHDTINPKGDYTHPELVKNVQHVLSRDWDIKGPADLSDTLNHLHNQATFTRDQHGWKVLSNLELGAAVNSEPLGNYRNVMDMVKNYRHDVEGNDFAWHYGRCTWLIRMSTFLGYVSVEEAWTLMEYNGKKIRELFSSWADFGLSYMVGAQYWRQNSYTPEAVRRYTQHYQFLLTNDASPWKNIAWEVEI